MPDYRINVIVDPSSASAGTRVVKRELDSLALAGKAIQNVLRDAFAFIGIGAGVKAITDLADAYVNAKNRINTVTKSQEELNVVFKELTKVATDTGIKFETVVESYTRTASSVKNLGKSQNEVINFTKTLNEAVVLSGATAVEASGALIQLSQGLGSGTLRGQELRSVLEQLPVVADLIVAELNRLNPGLNATRGALSKLAQTGIITNELLFNAVMNGTAGIREGFDKLTPTIGRALQTLRTNFINMIGEFNNFTGAQTSFAKAIQFVADNIETFGRAILGLTILLTTQYAARGIKIAIEATLAFTRTLLKNPFVAIVTALITVIPWIISFADKIKISTDGMADLRDLAIVTWDAIKLGIQSLVDYVSVAFPNLTRFVSATFEGFSLEKVLREMALSIDAMTGLIQGLLDFNYSAWSKLGTAIPLIWTNIMNKVKTIVADGVNYTISAINPLLDMAGIDNIKNVSSGAKDVSQAEKDYLAIDPVADFNKGLNSSNAATKTIDDLMWAAEMNATIRGIQQEEMDKAEKIALAGLNNKGTKVAPTNTGDEKLETFDNITAKIIAQTKALEENATQREIDNQKIQVAYRLKRELAPEEDRLLTNLYQQKQAMEDQAEIWDRLRQPQQDFARGQAAINALFEKGKITQQEYNKELRNLRIASLETATDLKSGIVRGMLEVQESFGDVSRLASDAVVNAFGEAEDAIVKFVQTGKLSITDLVNSIEADLTRLAVRQAITEPLAGMLGLGGTGTTAGSSGGGIFGSLIGGFAGLFGGGGGAASGASIQGLPWLSSGQTAVEGLPWLAGFATGGSFDVGGHGGTDSQLVAFKATPGENVSITRGDQKDNKVRNGDGNTTVIFNIETPDVEGFNKSRNQYLGSLAKELARTKARLT